MHISKKMEGLTESCQVRIKKYKIYSSNNLCGLIQYFSETYLLFFSRPPCLRITFRIRMYNMNAEATSFGPKGHLVQLLCYYMRLLRCLNTVPPFYKYLSKLRASYHHNPIARSKEIAAVQGLLKPAPCKPTRWHAPSTLPLQSFFSSWL